MKATASSGGSFTRSRFGVERYWHSDNYRIDSFNGAAQEIGEAFKLECCRLHRARTSPGSSETLPAQSCPDIDQHQAQAHQEKLDCWIARGTDHSHLHVTAIPLDIEGQMFREGFHADGVQVFCVQLLFRYHALRSVSGLGLCVEAKP